jgi:hypothetical protein
MTDNKIVKALECCAEHPNCKNCPCVDKIGCVNLISKDALDLIKRQKAEIERLESKVNRLKQYDEERDIRLHARLTATARTEAIKEFAERLKSKTRKLTEYDEGGWDMDVYAVSVDDIDNLVKEMTEENK